jgi:DNA repair exonuclease SbcCD ATPase subunit
MNTSNLQIQLKNFRRFLETGVIVFPPGLTIISGQNGAGKSTLVEAIICNLYGPRRRRNISDLRTDNISGDFCVECELSIDNQPIKIIRSGNTATLWINNTLQVQGGSSSLNMVNRQISALLGGLTREQFENTYVALQGDTAGLVQDTPEERRKIIERILQLEVIAKAVQLQGKRCDEVQSDLLAQSKQIFNEFSFPDTTRELMRKFQDARKYEIQVHHLQRFTNTCEQTLVERRGFAQEAKDDMTKTQTDVISIERKWAEHQKIINHTACEYEQQEQLLMRYQEVGQHIARIGGQLQQVEQDIGAYEGYVQQAKHCAHAAQEYAQLEGEMTICESRLGRIPLIEKCYSAFLHAQNTLGVLEKRLADLACFC